MIAENVRIATKAIRANKMRSALTTLGIVIGVAAVVAVVSIVQGLDHAITREFESVGGTYIKVIPFADPNDPESANREMLLTYEDGLAVMEQATAIEHFNPLFVHAGRATRRDRKEFVTVLGVGAFYQEVSNHWIERGRFFSTLDLDRRAPVCLVGRGVVDSLRLGADPVGAEIAVDGEPCTVIGIFEKKGHALGEDPDKVVTMPITTAEDRYGVGASRRIHLDFQAVDADSVERAKDQITAVLRKRHAIADGKGNDFFIVMQEEILKTTSTILGTVTWVVAAIVGISLMVGGIGIMNVMLVSVTERTREIGIRKAVGARRSDILVQFLLEAVALSLFGGVLGVVLGAAIGVVGAKLIPGFPDAHVPWWSIALAFGFAATVGVIFGTYPAAKAAALDPIESLRYE